MLEKFDANAVWSQLLGINATSGERVNVFMAVPTIYVKLIEEYNKVFASDEKMVEYIKTTLANKVRLMVSGSAPLTVPVYERWLEISGHKLLERYGMTEIGMALSNGYDSDRKPGFVGVPLPGVSVRVAEEREDSPRDYIVHLECSNINNQITTKPKEIKSDLVGELLVKGDSVFTEYVNNGQATKTAFTHEGWFRTGDVVRYYKDLGIFKILGRTSVDIIKSGGHKLSALEIETVILTHPNIKECAIIGIADKIWGESIAAVIVMKREESISIEQLRNYLKDKLPRYSLPTILKVVAELPRNAMGKVNKKELGQELFPKTD